MIVRRWSASTPRPAAAALASFAGRPPAVRVPGRRARRGVLRRLRSHPHGDGRDDRDRAAPRPPAPDRAGPAPPVFARPGALARARRERRRADLVVVTDVYGAGADPIPGVTGELVADGVRRAAPATPVVYLPHARSGGLPDRGGARRRPRRDDGMRRRVDARRRGDRAHRRTAMDDRRRPRRDLLRAACGDRLRVAFPMAPLTTFRIGGPAALFLEPEDDEDLAAVAAGVAQTEVPRRDRQGFEHPGRRRGVPRAGPAARRGVPVGGPRGDGSPRAAPCRSRRSPGSRCGTTGGTRVRGRDPGQLGGAVRMNAGAHERAMSEVVGASRSSGWRRERRVRPGGRPASPTVAHPASDAVVIAARWRSARASAEIRAPMDEARDWRRAPNRWPSRIAGASSRTRRAITRRGSSRPPG